MSNIDITFDVFSDTPTGKDPDKFSATLRDYHRQLWSKSLPNGGVLELDENIPYVLSHKSILGEFSLSSDAITHTYRSTKKMSHIISELPTEEMEIFFALASTIGAYIIFPSHRIDGKMTINAARGFNQKLNDRFDLALECIRRFYLNEHSPLTDVLNRYSDFFGLFETFRGYTDFFLLQDLVEDDYQHIKFWHPFVSFKLTPLPQSMKEYLAYKQKCMNFISERNQRIKNYSDCWL